MSAYRFRVGDGGFLVLQIMEAQPHPYYGQEKVHWRDATVEDIPVADPFATRRGSVAPYATYAQVE